MIAPHLPATVIAENTEPTDADRHAHTAVEHAAQLGKEDPDAAGEAAADTADEIADALENQDPSTQPLDDSKTSRQALFQRLGWMAAGVGAAGGAGAAGGVTLIPVANGFSPIWAATLGAIAGVLAYLFKTKPGKTEPTRANNDQ